MILPFIVYKIEEKRVEFLQSFLRHKFSALPSKIVFWWQMFIFAGLEQTFQTVIVFFWNSSKPGIGAYCTKFKMNHARRWFPTTYMAWQKLEFWQENTSLTNSTPAFIAKKWQQTAFAANYYVFILIKSTWFLICKEN